MSDGKAGSGAGYVIGCLVMFWLSVVAMVVLALWGLGAVAGLWGSLGDMVSFFGRLPSGILRGDSVAVLEGGAFLVVVAALVAIVWHARRR